MNIARKQVGPDGATARIGVGAADMECELVGRKKFHIEPGEYDGKFTKWETSGVFGGKGFLIFEPHAGPFVDGCSLWRAGVQDDIPRDGYICPEGTTLFAARNITLTPEGRIRVAHGSLLVQEYCRVLGISPARLDRFSPANLIGPLFRVRIETVDRYANGQPREPHMKYSTVAEILRRAD